ncbi:MAG TPA: cytochrome C oxidase subunit IV family protein [Bacillales bacterium]|nr:cytochrome C oxidase subunit IV family protein [Bacillales bacterium]
MESNSNHMSSIKEKHERQLEKKELRNHLVSFAMMIVLTVLAFIAVAMGASSKFVPLFILLLAVIQAAFQMFYFMHMKDKNHEFPIGFIASGVTVAVLTVATLMTLIWYK